MSEGAIASATSVWTASRAEVGGIAVRLVRIGAAKDPADLPVIVLHGWNAHLEAIAPIVAPLAEETEVLALDLPGMGESDDPPEPWGSEDYARFVAALLERAGIERCHVVGHSRGGAIAICLASGQPELVERMILVDSAGLRPKRGWRYRTRVAMAKLGRLLGLFGPPGRRLQDRIRGRVASTDYLESSEEMRATFRRVIAEDLSDRLPGIEKPCLLVWGKQDDDTPLWRGRRMEELLPDGALVAIDGAGHFSYADQPAFFARAARRFLVEQPREAAARGGT
ncbi:MAG: alpha/beta hydrolase [Solirubrobacterales bacterium]